MIIADEARVVQLRLIEDDAGSGHRVNSSPQGACHPASDERAAVTGTLVVDWSYRFAITARGDDHALLGFVHVSDHARQQLDDGLPKRSCGNGFARAAAPLTESCALRAGRKVL